MAPEDDDGTANTVASDVASDATVAASSAPPRGTGDHAALVTVAREHYTIGRELARGGMGRISTARDHRLGRTVAIKELIADDAGLAARFEREARITARLQHPAIIHVHEAGRWPTGEPFYAMTLVSGRPLDRVVAEAKTLAARLALVPNAIAVVDALAYAHGERVIHRDLKPSNVLVGAFGETVVIDWGLAKDLDGTDAADVPDAGPRRVAAGGETVAGAVLGTPAYMPPEQADGAPVDARADVYALGALLYHVLAGVPPYVGRTADGVLAAVIAGPPVALATRAPDAPADLVAIVEHAMARDPDARFPTAREMAIELKRFQTGQLVASHRYSTGELVRRWIRRHRGAVIVGGLAALVLVGIGSIAIWRVVDEKHRADAEATRARTAQTTAEDRADQVRLAQARASLATDPSAALAWLGQLADDGPARWGGARTIAADALARGVAHVLAVGTRTQAIAFAADGAHLASGGDDGVVRVWDLATWTPRVIDRASAPILAIAFAADTIVAVDATGTAKRCTLADARCTVARAGVAPFVGAAIAPDAKHVAMFRSRWTNGDYLPAELVDLVTGTARSLDPYEAGAWAPDGATIMLTSEERVDRLDVAGAVTPAMKGGAFAIAFDGKRIAASRGESRIFLEPRAIVADHSHTGPITALAFAPDGAVVSASSDYEVLKAGVEGGVVSRSYHAGDYTIVVDRDDGRPVQLRGHGGNIDALAVSPRGDAIASSGADGTIRVWHLPSVARRGKSAAFGTDSLVAAALDGGRTIAVGARPELVLRDVETGAMTELACCDKPDEAAPAGLAPSFHLVDRRVVIDEPIARRAMTIARAPDGRHVVVVDSEHEAFVWDLAKKRGRILTYQATTAAIGNATVATIDPLGEVRRWNVTTGAAERVPLPDAARAIALSTDGATIAAATDKAIVVVRAGATARELAKPAEPIALLAFAPDGATLVGGGARGSVVVWDVARGTLRTWPGHAGAITRVAFSRDGRTLASTGDDKTVRIWQLADGSALVLRGHAGRIQTLELGDDGASLVTASDDGTARVWDLQSGEGRTLPASDDVVVYAGYAPDRRTIVTLDTWSALLAFPDDLPHDPAGLRARIAAATNLTVDADGHLVPSQPTTR